MKRYTAHYGTNGWVLRQHHHKPSWRDDLKLSANVVTAAAITICSIILMASTLAYAVEVFVK